MIKIDRQYLTEKEVAKMLNRAPETIKSWRKNGTGPEYHIDPKGRVHYDKERVLKWFRGQ